ncbi:MAG: hypothetical protein OQL20_08550 [Sedimenticola sp.]|nr:hypothetical protein [Sedimenticola sp.]
MEFFRQLEQKYLPEQIQELCTLERLPELCDSIDSLLEHQGEQGEIYCLWGRFKIHRERIKQGVRFSLPGCPNALTWTVTAEPESLVIHCTINRSEHDPDFIESIDQFVDDWLNGLERNLTRGS